VDKPLRRLIGYARGARIPGATSPGRINFVQWFEFSAWNLLCLTHLGRRVLRCLSDFGKFVHYWDVIHLRFSWPWG
jgi:hypothetical protein